MASVSLTKNTNELRAEAKERSMRTRGDGDSLGAKAPGRIPLLASPAKHGSLALHIVYTLRQGSLGLQGETVKEPGWGCA